MGDVDGDFIRVPERSSKFTYTQSKTCETEPRRLLMDLSDKILVVSTAWTQLTQEMLSYQCRSSLGTQKPLGLPMALAGCLLMILMDWFLRFLMVTRDTVSGLAT